MLNNQKCLYKQQQFLGSIYFILDGFLYLVNMTLFSAFLFSPVISLSFMARSSAISLSLSCRYFFNSIPIFESAVSSLLGPSVTGLASIAQTCFHLGIIILISLSQWHSPSVYFLLFDFCRLKKWQYFKCPYFPLGKLHRGHMGLVEQLLSTVASYQLITDSLRSTFWYRHRIVFSILIFFRFTHSCYFRRATVGGETT